jgi:hypothetical protein
MEIILTHLVSTGEDRLTPSGQTILHYRRSCSPSSARILNALKVCRFSAIASMTSKTDITTLRHFGFLAHGSRSRLSNLVSTSPTGKSPLRGIRSSNRDKPSLVVEADERHNKSPWRFDRGIAAQYSLQRPVAWRVIRSQSDLAKGEKECARRHPNGLTERSQD